MMHNLPTDTNCLSGTLGGRPKAVTSVNASKVGVLSRRCYFGLTRAWTVFNTSSDVVSFPKAINRGSRAIKLTRDVGYGTFRLSAYQQPLNLRVLVSVAC
ncbi:hypothetical protein DPMN_088242 [Dreissena polymorpha]|uniref:Uncharacterized protein n=1 Tax=Dreissena polymorpha TaxID=45954 RepID=A0A9D4KTS2_DREPO|nr:hypothetical protein DPMN_088242 [Dreissena polymorpha]